MHAFRAVQDVSEDGFIKIKVPTDLGKRVEVILLPARPENTDVHDSASLTPTQQQNGFCMQILAAEEEDVWNDL